jgi:hypothetical protein
MIEPNDVTIITRARLADELAGIVEADPRVRRWRRLDFADDGGAVMRWWSCTAARTLSPEASSRESSSSWPPASCRS